MHNFRFVTIFSAVAVLGLFNLILSIYSARDIGKKWNWKNKAVQADEIAISQDSKHENIETESVMSENSCTTTVKSFQSQISVLSGFSEKNKDLDIDMKENETIAMKQTDKSEKSVVSFRHSIATQCVTREGEMRAWKSTSFNTL